MPVGDSMTIGSAGEHTWRYRMWRHLRDTYGGPFALVGPRKTLHDKATDAPTSYEYADPDFPRGHLAGWGEGWHHMVPLIGEAVRSSRADVLMVSLGLIDLGFYTNAEQTADNVRRFVTEARAARPRVRMVVLPVIPNIRAATEPSFAAQVDLFNVLLAKTLADLDGPRSPCCSPLPHPRTTSTTTPTTAPTRTQPASTRSQRRSRGRCGRRGGSGSRTRLDRIDRFAESLGHHACRCTARLHPSVGQPDRIAMADVDTQRLDEWFERLERMPVPEGFRVEIVGGNVFITPQRDTHWGIILRIVRAVEDRFGMDVNVLSDVRIDFPGHQNGFCPDVALLKDSAQKDATGHPKDGDYAETLKVDFGTDIDLSGTVVDLVLKTDGFPRD